MSQSKRRGSAMWCVIGLSVVTLGTAVPVRGDVTVPNTFTAGTAISASQVNQNFATLATAMPSTTNMYNYTSGNITDTPGTDVIAVTVTPPADGFIIVSGTARYTITQSSAGSDRINASLSMWVGGTHQSTSPSVNVALDTTGGAAQVLTSSLTASHVFPVSSGVAATIKLTGVRATGSSTDSYSCPFMHVVFVPNQLPCTPASSGGSAGNYGLCY